MKQHFTLIELLVVPVIIVSFPFIRVMEFTVDDSGTQSPMSGYSILQKRLHCYKDRSEFYDFHIIFRFSGLDKLPEREY